MKFIVRCLGWLALTSGAFAHSPEGCATYTWDLAREFAALAAPAKNVIADSSAARPKRWLTLGKHHDATLAPQTGVRFVTAPARARNPENATAGLLHFRSGKAGRYRISLNSHHWIDVVDGDKAIASVAHEGRSGCERLHKVVEFDLPARHAITIQLSGAATASVSVVITGPT